MQSQTKGHHFTHFLVMLVFLLLAKLAQGLELTAQASVCAHGLRGKVDQIAVEELLSHLERIFGRRPDVVSDGNANAPGATIVLQSEATLSPEEWRILATESQLLIAGGFPRGLYYGVCEFLERFAGVRHFTKNDCLIPQRESFTIPQGQVYRRKPAFPLQRKIVTDVEYGQDNDHFYAFNKATCTTDSDFPDDLHTSPSVGGGCHTFHIYTRLIPQDRPDMLPVNAEGKPVRATSGMGPGQICFTNRDFRELVKREVGKQIAERHALIQKLGVAPSSVLGWYNLSQNDNDSYCRCEGCKALVSQYGTVSGALLDFVNDIASTYPDMLFETFAYMGTEEPPHGIRPRENVMMQFAQIGRSGVWYDSLRPLSHPANATPLRILDSWNGIAGKRSIWAYHRLYEMSEAFAWPQCMYWYISENMRRYRDYGAQRVFVEAEYCRGGIYAPRALHDLHNYLTVKLMDNPDADGEALANEFLAGVYGPAAPAIHDYALYLRKRLDGIEGSIPAKPLWSRKLLDREFFQNVWHCLDGAEKLAAGDSSLLNHIAVERIPVDFAALHIWDESIEACAGMKREEVGARLSRCVKLAWERFRPHPSSNYYDQIGRQHLQKTLAFIETLQKSIAVPSGLANRKLVQMPVASRYPGEAIEDADATLGRALKLGDMPGKTYNHDLKPMEFGIYDQQQKRVIIRRELKPEEVPQDGQYHLFLVGTYTLPKEPPLIQAWGQASWKLPLTRMVNDLWREERIGKSYEVYVSAKLIGPAYVKGSQDENAVYVDRMIFAEE
ncbi:MAG: DUF4838 domain-containing protein [Victivallales bacterium]|nr:DUF4838 domain-containing protein [Victivallales bacterium]